MLNLKKSILATAIAASTISVNAIAEEKGFMETMADGKATVSLRYRIENVAQDNDLKDATASTLKTRLNYKTGDYHGFGAFLEFDNVSDVYVDDYNSTQNGKGEYSVIADPTGNDLNQSYVSYVNSGAAAKYGRQRIILDNQRFVGGVGWRQNEQTFDALSGVYANDKLTATYAHIENQKNIFNALNDVNDDLINVQYKFSPALVLTGYGYLLSLEEGDNTGVDTLGASLTGKVGAFEYRAEAAQYDKEAGDISALYYHLTAGYKFGAVKVSIAQELLGSDDGKGAVGFTYGTNHAFNGWADVFLGTPNEGLVDSYVNIGATLGKFTLGALYHDFVSDYGSIDYGTEIDLVASTKVGPVGLLLKYADYSADDYKVDTQKVWLQGSLEF